MTGIAFQSLPPHLRVVMLHLFAEVKEDRGSAQFLLNPIIANEDALRRWQQTDVLIIDDVSILSGKLLDSIEFTARQVKNNNKVYVS